MKVLVISHTVLGKDSNMGKTLLHYFDAFGPNEMAQMYIHAEVPTDVSVCENYFRFTDKDALKSIIPIKKYGRIFHKEDIQTNRFQSRIDGGVTGRIYQFGRKRTGAIYLARNLMWKCSHWFTKTLRHWLDEFSPDVIFFASGDYAFMYDVARQISEYLKCPLVISCMDDYYVYYRNQGTFLGWLEHRFFMRSVRKTMDRASAIVPICETMETVYQQLFDCPTYVMHTPAQNVQLTLQNSARQISYIGNLGLGRPQQLIAIGRALKEINDPEGPLKVDVYSAEKRPEVLAAMTLENGIDFHGAIPADDVLRVMEKSMAVIHTESFERDIRQRVRFSVSTKIAESVMYGPCLLAYGPEGIASIDYLMDHQAAFVITREEDLKEKLRQFLSTPELRAEILENARELGRKNHDIRQESKRLRDYLEEIMQHGMCTANEEDALVSTRKSDDK